MFVQLEEGPPNIVRLFGRGKVFERGTAEFERRTEGMDLHVRRRRASASLDHSAIAKLLPRGSLSGQTKP